MLTKFDGLKGQEDWANALTALVNAARTALTTPSEEGLTRRKIDDLREELSRFIELSPVREPWSTALDDQAAAALGILHVGLLTATTHELESRTIELQRITKTIRGLVESNQEWVDTLRHERLGTLLKELANTAKAAKDLQSALQQGPEHAKLAASTVALLRAVDEFRVHVTE